MYPINRKVNIPHINYIYDHVTGYKAKLVQNFSQSLNQKSRNIFEIITHILLGICQYILPSVTQANFLHGILRQVYTINLTPSWMVVWLPVTGEHWDVSTFIFSEMKTRLDLSLKQPRSIQVGGKKIAGTDLWRFHHFQWGIKIWHVSYLNYKLCHGTN